MLRLRFAPLSMTLGSSAPAVVMLSEAKYLIPLTVVYLGRVVTMYASKLYKLLLLALIAWGCEPETAADRPALVAELPDGTEMAFVWIDPGTFVMGSPPTEPGRDDDEAPQREVQITGGST